ncbi:fluoride efflux transporter FluC [Cohnella sp. GCM10027633]|uniref:fluoride efflux transporter FluC n=1 Tax=unclassified Cohnella TaxID=2636738 RepID=UPI00362F3DC3
MNVPTVLLIGLGGTIGTLLRYGAGVWVAKQGKPGFLATLAVNLVGSFAIGLLLGLGWPDRHEEAYAFAATGILGGLTTYSTLNVQKATLRKTASRKTIVTYLIATYAGGIGFTAAGVGVSYLIT